ncbi:hypothetical protein BpHYR1_008003, partial [Brachionus plicatilis]
DFNTRSTIIGTEKHTFTIEANQNNSALNFPDANEHDTASNSNSIKPTLEINYKKNMDQISVLHFNPYSIAAFNFSHWVFSFASVYITRTSIKNIRIEKYLKEQER